jgi:hypothetical protein
VRAAALRSTTGDRRGPTGLPVVDPRDPALGWVFGRFPAAPCPQGRSGTVREALEAALLPALRRTPCVIAFSGGRDSSLVAAVAVALSARHGLALPTLLTLRYPGLADADETEWQLRVVSHLRSLGHDPGWVIQDITDEVDLLGPTVGEVALAHGGVVWPPALGTILQLARHARGGVLVTGEFGDELLGPRRATYLSGALRIRPWNLGADDRRAVAAAAVPGPLRRVGVGVGEGRPWLRDAARRRHSALARLDAAADPLRWDTSVRAVPQWRASNVGHQTLRAVARGRGVELVEPLGDRGFVESLARAGGARGLGSRTAAMRLVAGGLLPDDVLGRRSKARFNGAVFGTHTRAFLRSWDGRGLDEDLVDVGRLRQEWSADTISAASTMLLQQAWLAAQGVST